MCARQLLWCRIVEKAFAHHVVLHIVYSIMAVLRHSLCIEKGVGTCVTGVALALPRSSNELSDSARVRE